MGNTYKMENKPALRKPIIQEQEQKDDQKSNVDEKDIKETQQKQNQQNDDDKKDSNEDSQKGPETIRLIPNSNIGNFIQQHHIPLNNSVSNKVCLLYHMNLD